VEAWRQHTDKKTGNLWEGGAGNGERKKPIRKRQECREKKSVKNRTQRLRKPKGVWEMASAGEKKGAYWGPGEK